MKTINSVAVVYGGDSSEWEVSCRGGEFVSSRIDETRFEIYQIFIHDGKWNLVAYRKRNSMRVTFPEGARPEIDKTDFSVSVLGEKIKFDFAYIMVHGTPGENGLLGGYFEMLGVPYSCCGANVSAIAFDKYACKRFLGSDTLPKMAPDAVVRKGEDVSAAAKAISSELTFPVFVKPTSGGSSFGVTLVNKPQELEQAILFAFSESEIVLVEQKISGEEFTCAAYRDGKDIKALPPVQIISENEYFDYDAKYNGHSREVCPAPISAEETALIQEATCNIFGRLGCKGVVRMDYIKAPDGLYFLEANTIPGMTGASIVPKMVKAAGIDITDFLSTIIDNA